METYLKNLLREHRNRSILIVDDNARSSQQQQQHPQRRSKRALLERPASSEATPQTLCRRHSAALEQPWYLSNETDRQRGETSIDSINGFCRGRLGQLGSSKKIFPCSNDIQPCSYDIRKPSTTVNLTKKSKKSKCQEQDSASQRHIRTRWSSTSTDLPQDGRRRGSLATSCNSLVPNASSLSPPRLPQREQCSKNGLVAAIYRTRSKEDTNKKRKGILSMQPKGGSLARRKHPPLSFKNIGPFGNVCSEGEHVDSITAEAQQIIIKILKHAADLFVEDEGLEP